MIRQITRDELVKVWHHWFMEMTQAEREASFERQRLAEKAWAESSEQWPAESNPSPAPPQPVLDPIANPD